MAAYLFDWMSLLGRFMHVIFGIAWIGASFYFVWLDNHLEAITDPELAKKGVGGEVWALHGGGFYNAQKYKLAPRALPVHLHWFYWEAYSTWLSGLFLLCLIYYGAADAFLIDKSVANITPQVAIGIGLATLVGGWIVYDRLCASPLGRSERALGAVLTVLIAAAAWGLCHVYSGRGAFIHFGAMLGTIMVANVFFVIIPAQRELVAATSDGRDPDPAPGLRAKQRSVHNTYFTLPVLFTMISNHYAMTFGGTYNWAVLMALTLSGAFIRVYFVARHKSGSRASPLPLAASVVLLAATVVALMPTAPITGTAAANPQAEFIRVQGIVNERCVACHAPNPTQPGFAAPPNGVMLDTPERILAQRAKMRVQLASKAMPIGNLTRMTDDERALVLAWIEGSHS